MIQTHGIEYKKGKGKYKYTLLKEYVFDLPFIAPHVIEAFLDIHGNQLIISKDYAWDGATSAIDTPDFMRGSLVHDALYQLIRTGWLGKEYRIEADKALKAICLEDGMPKWRANYIYYAVRLFGWRYV